ncbi:MAG: precorrin-6y C5,15-methyltransferase (decarboxylating) subunit CbiE [Eggerthellaceae bacterium]|nr:precorrin-6y C5,15-methyltransferase (decarboxylating) subunit CbiE [Eggerthellaceae bacterium]
MKVYMIGVGMGNVDTLTVGALRAIEGSQLLIGAPRLLEPFGYLGCKTLELIRSDDIVAALGESDASQASILLSGDVGFYSGATLLYDKLDGFDVEVIPGISSLVYFCAKQHTPWQDAKLVSAHGRQHNAVGAIQSHAKTFCITGGQTKVEDICAQLVQRGLGSVRVAAGERLSYDDERIVQGTAEELSQMSFADLSVMLVRNDAPVRRAYAAPSLRDGDFERGRAPMTKEEVRALVIAKLRIAPNHTMWDVGAGTGSVSIEAALAASSGTVYAIERNDDALELMQRNKETYGVANMQVVSGLAPDALEGLPAPDRVFIGGSSGNLDAIVMAALRANPRVRICITAVTLETLGDVMTCIRKHEFDDVDIVQVSVARADAVGSYHLMRAENPVYIVTFEHTEVVKP